MGVCVSEPKRTAYTRTNKKREKKSQISSPSATFLFSWFRKHKSLREDDESHGAKKNKKQKKHTHTHTRDQNLPFLPPPPPPHPELAGRIPIRNEEAKGSIFCETAMIPAVSRAGLVRRTDHQHTFADADVTCR